MAEIDRTPKPCLHKLARHEHGTRNCYSLDRCRCYACSYAVSVYNQQLLTGQIRDFYTEAEPIRRYVLWLMEDGQLGRRRIAALAGVPETCVSNLVWGKRGRPVERMKSENARKLLAVVSDPEPGTTQVAIRRAGGVRVEALGTARRIRALVALGWSQTKLAGHLGWTPANFAALTHGERPVNQRTADKVVAMYEQLSMRRPPEGSHRDRIAASRARNYAKAHGWLPPLAWDDDGLDNPEYVPTVPKDKGLAHDGIDEAAIIRRMNGEKIRLSKASKVELLRQWKASGRSLNECERITGLNPDRYRQVGAA